ncbi:hypothetical protein, partial [Tychonema sp. LEGE 07196]|uniref:hypothetical protein n=1 Tax=Tychonema sp. LEGE 07196 TaxID=1828665 RepID=UPI001D14D344
AEWPLSPFPPLLLTIHNWDAQRLSGLVTKRRRCCILRQKKAMQQRCCLAATVSFASIPGDSCTVCRPWT